MKTLTDITFLVPCLNEEENIQGALEKIAEVARIFPYQCEILVFDDGSTDNTFKIVKKISEDNFPLPIQIVRNQKTKGVGFSYFTGAQRANGTYYMAICGDNTEPVETMRDILSQLGKADMIIPYYWRRDGRPITRRLLSSVFMKLINILSGNRIHYYNGCVLHLTKNVVWASLKTCGFGYQAELICKLLQRNKTYLEVHSLTVARQGGFSKAFRLKNILSVGGSLFRILGRRVQRTLWSSTYRSRFSP